MKKNGLQYIMLNYIDGTNKRWNSKRVRNSINEILALKQEWDMVLTHNYEGEYGHSQHKQLFENISQCYSGNKLYISVPKNKLYNIENKLSEEERIEKIRFMEDVYKSQDKLSDYIIEYYNYEGIVKYNKY